MDRFDDVGNSMEVLRLFETMGVISVEKPKSLEVLQQEANALGIFLEQVRLPNGNRGIRLKQKEGEGYSTQLEDASPQVDILSHKIELAGYIVVLEPIRRATRALKALTELNRSKQIKIVQPHIHAIHQLRSQIKEIADQVNAPAICTKCQGCCCGRTAEKTISSLDYFYAFWHMSQGQRAKLLEVIRMSDQGTDDCRFQQQTGCVMAPDNVPHVCQAFYCEGIPMLGTRTGDHYLLTLRKKMSELSTMLIKMGCPLKI